jgi:DNA polymerase
VLKKLDEIAKAVSLCRKCPLHRERRLPVPGEGATSPEIMFVGEAPGFEEDCAGRPFVGAAGELLTRMIEAMGYKREQVFIANIIKCRPPANRTPYPDEISQCLPYLNEQIRILKPRVIVALGATAAKAFWGQETSISKVRGRFMSYMGIPVMPTYHPAFLLRSPAFKKEAWADLLKVLTFLGRKI